MKQCKPLYERLVPREILLTIKSVIHQPHTGFIHAEENEDIIFTRSGKNQTPVKPTIKMMMFCGKSRFLREFYKFLKKENKK